MTDAVVIGAGIGGLCAAIRLAASGWRVTVIERHERPGGKANIALVEGVEVDTGPSVVTMLDAFDAVFRAAGSSLDREVDILRPEIASRYVFPGGPTIDLYADHDATLAHLADVLGPGAAEEYRDFLVYSKQIWDAAAPHFVYGAAPTVGSIARLGWTAVQALSKIDPLRSMSGAIKRRLRTRELQWIFTRYATYNGSDPRRAPATLNCIAHVELGLGVYAVDGGIYALVRALVRTAERLGVELHLGTPVTAIRYEGGRVTGVETPDQVVPAEVVVANADASHVLTELLGPVQHGLEADPPRSMSGWVGIAAATPIAERVGHTVLFPADYDAEFEDIFDHDRPPASPTVYLCAQGRCHRRPGWPDGREPLFMMANAPPEPADRPRDEATWQQLRSTVEARVRDHGLLAPDDPVRWMRSPTTLAADYPGTRGAIYGAASNDRFAAFRRPPNRVARVPGLYLASGSAHPGGGMPLCALSGLAAADAVLEDHGPKR